MYAMLLAATTGAFDKVALDKIKAAEEALFRELKSKHKKVVDAVNTGDKVSDENQKAILDIAKTIAKTYEAKEA
jgi:F0F1-type ATP synthase alpha subunit